MKRTPSRAARLGAAKSAPSPSRADSVPGAGAGAVMEWLERRGTRRTRDGMARYGIPSDKAFGVTVGEMQRMARRLGRNHALAAELGRAAGKKRA